MLLGIEKMLRFWCKNRGEFLLKGLNIRESQAGVLSGNLKINLFFQISGIIKN